MPAGCISWAVAELARMTHPACHPVETHLLCSINRVLALLDLPRSVSVSIEVCDQE